MVHAKGDFGVGIVVFSSNALVDEQYYHTRTSGQEGKEF